MDAHFFFVHRASTHTQKKNKSGKFGCVPFVFHISIDQRFITAKINQSSLNNASPAIVEKDAEYVSAELKCGSGYEKCKAGSRLSFYV